MKQSSPPATKRDAVVRVPRCREDLDAQRAGLDRAARHLEPEAPDELVVARDVVGVPVRDEQVRRGQPLALDRLEERLERRAAVHEHRRAARLVPEEVRIGQPGRMERSLDEHGLAPLARERGVQECGDDHRTSSWTA